MFRNGQRRVPRWIGDWVVQSDERARPRDVLPCRSSKSQQPRSRGFDSHDRVKHTSTHFVVLQSVFRGHVGMQVSEEDMTCITVVDHRE
jgi:hypothetical protein